MIHAASRITNRVFAAFALLVLVPACGAAGMSRSPQVSSTTTTTGTIPQVNDPSPPATPSSAELESRTSNDSSSDDPGAPIVSDAEIAEVLDSVDNGETAQARAALAQSKDPRVREFAQQVISDHAGAGAELRALDEKNAIVLRESDRSDQIDQSSERALSAVRTADASHIDETYVSAQVTEQKDLLTLLDTYLPKTRSLDLRNHLAKFRADVARHLSAATELQARIHRQ